MSLAQRALMKAQMAWMKQEMLSEFAGDNEEQNTDGPVIYEDDTSDDEMSVSTRSQSLSTEFNCLTMIEARVSSSSASSPSAPFHGSSSTAVRADESPRYITISGDYTEVDNNVYQSNFDSYKVENNIVENSFGEGEQEILY